MGNLEYVLRFALDVIEQNELEFTKNKDNWILGEAIEEQLALCSVVKSDSEQLFCENVIHHNCKWFDEYNGCMGCLVKKHEAK